MVKTKALHKKGMVFTPEHPNRLNPFLAQYAPYNPQGMPVPVDFPDALEGRSMAELAALNRLMGPARRQFVAERRAGV